MAPDDVQDVKAEEAAAQSTETKKEPPKEPEKPASPIPETGHFDGESMDKYIDQIELANEDKPEAKPADKPAAESKEEKKPCANCDDEGREPIESYVHNGETHHLYTKEQVKEALQKSHNVDYRLDRVKAEQAQLDKIVPALQNLNATLSAGKKPDQAGAQDGEIDLDTIADPAAAELIKTLITKVDKLEGDNQGLKQDKARQDTQRVGQEMDHLFEEVQKETPFDLIKDPETGENITERVFAGINATLYNVDVAKAKADADHKIKPMSEYFKLSGKDLNTIENHYRKKFGDNGDAEITAASILENHPEIATEIGQRAIANHLRQQGDTTVPIAKTEKADAVSEPKSKDEKPKSSDDYFDAAEKDPELTAEFDRLQKAHP